MKIKLFFFSVLLLVLSTDGHDSYAQKSKPKKGVEGVKLTEAKIREAEFYFTEGQKYFILEDYSKALGLFQRSLEIDPSNATVHFKIAEILFRSQKEEDVIKASEFIDTAISLQRNNKYFYLLAGNISSSLLRFDKAIAYYEQMLAEINGTEDYLFELAVLYLYREKLDEAIDVYNRAEAFYGVNEISSIQKQKIYLQQNKISEAFNEAEKLLEAFPDEERYHMAYAEMLTSNQQLHAAIARLEKFIKAHPYAGNAKYLLAGYYRDAGKETEARTLILEIISDQEIAFNSKVIIFSSYNALIEENHKKGIDDKSTKLFLAELLDKLIESHPDEGSVYILAGDMHLNLGNVNEARNQYQTSLSYDDTNFSVWQNLLSIDAQLNQIDSLLVNTEKALELFPNQGLFYYFNGFALNRKKRYKEATATLEHGKRLAANDKKLLVEINSLLGDTYNAYAEYEKSDAAYEAALEIDPENAFVLNNYSYYLSLRKQNLDKAEKMAAKLTKDHPNNPSFLDTYAWVLFAREKYKDARKVIERVIDSGQANATHYEHYGDILFKLGDVDSAIIQWQKSKGLNPNNELIDKKISDRKFYE